VLGLALATGHGAKSVATVIIAGTTNSLGELRRLKMNQAVADVKNPPKCRCGQLTQLAQKEGRLFWVCFKCYPKFPERMHPYPLCPLCGAEMEAWAGSDFQCNSCHELFRPRYWDYYVIPSGAVPLYHEIKNEDIWYWWRTTPTTLPNWTEREKTK